MNTINISTTRPVRRFPAIALIGVLALALAAAITAVAQQTGVTGAGIVASMGDYLTEVAEALGSG